MAETNKKLKTAVIILASLVLVAIIAAFIYLAWETLALKPPEVGLEEREDWLSLLAGETFDIDSSTDDVRLLEMMFTRISRVEFNHSGSIKIEMLPCTFYTRRPEQRIEGVVWQGDDGLICTVGGTDCPIWLEIKDNDTVLILQGSEDRLLFTPDNPHHFQP